MNNNNDDNNDDDKKTDTGVTRTVRRKRIQLNASNSLLPEFYSASAKKKDVRDSSRFLSLPSTVLHKVYIRGLTSPNRLRRSNSVQPRLVYICSRCDWTIVGLFCNRICLSNDRCILKKSSADYDRYIPKIYMYLLSFFL